MNKAQNPEPRFELLQADNFSQYLLYERREIAFILRQLAAKRSMITAYYGEQSDFLLTSVVGMDADDRRVYLDLGTDEQVTATAMMSGQLTCMTQLDKVKVQFALNGLERTRLEGFPALQAATPSVLLRLQRREYYRLVTPSTDALICQIPLSEIDGGRVEVRVVDISGGGIAVVAPPSGVKFEPDMSFRQCRLFLPEHGPITATLRVCNVFRMTSPGGNEMLRAGCQFLNLAAPMANAIQRYILKAERERNSRG